MRTCRRVSRSNPQQAHMASYQDSRNRPGLPSNPKRKHRGPWPSPPQGGSRPLAESHMSWIRNEPKKKRVLCMHCQVWDTLGRPAPAVPHTFLSESRSGFGGLGRSSSGFGNFGHCAYYNLNIVAKPVIFIYAEFKKTLIFMELQFVDSVLL